MTSTLIETLENNWRKYIEIDEKCGMLYVVRKSAGSTRVLIGVPYEDSETFNNLPGFWQIYCRIAWRQMKR